MERKTETLETRGVPGLIKDSNCNLNLPHNGYDASLSESMFDYRVLNNYNYGLESLIIKKESFDEFFNIFKEKFKPKVYYFELNNVNFYYLEHEDFFSSITYDDSNPIFYVYTKKLDDLYEMYKLYKEHASDLQEQATVNYAELTPSPHGIKTTVKELTLANLKDINKKYYPFLNVDLMIKEFIESTDNILILTGEPGVGKSKLFSTILKEILQKPEYIKSFKKPKLVEQQMEINDIEDLEDALKSFGSLQQEKVYHVAAAKNISMLALDSFWVEAKKYNFLIFDDLDYVLSSRDSSREDTEKNQFLSHLLSFTDGIEKNNTKIIITTNQPFSELDPALLRKGRLFAVLNFRPLSYDEALEVWIDEGLKEEVFEDYFGDKDEILQAELGNIIQNYKRNDSKIIEKQEFILDPSIDALNKAKKHKTGFV